MKTLENYTVLYDADCPMCKLYTNTFVKTGMLSENGRASYQNMPNHVCPYVDQQRAVNEIALINNETGEVTYGIKSLFIIIGHSFPFFNPLFSSPLFIKIMSVLYAFVSYNRRIIIPLEQVSENNFTYQPTFKINYRIAYLVFTWFITSIILNSYSHLLSGIIPSGDFYREFLICGGQILFQGLIVFSYKKEKTWEYLGNMMTISFAGSLLLLIPITLNLFANLNVVFYLIYFLVIVCLMLLEHIRRSKLLNLGWLLTITWILYRSIVLLIILN